jgi:hypothetical protein
MKAFVCLAISCLLIGLLYVYVRQQFAFQTNQIGQLTNLIKTMATEIVPRQEIKAAEPVEERADERIEVSDDSCSDTDSEDSSDEEEEPVKRVELEVELKEPVNELKVAKVEVDELPDLMVEEIGAIEAEEIDISSKKITIETNYEAWSLKDLKAKISEMGGPTLKTKKLMLEYLEKKV